MSKALKLIQNDFFTDLPFWTELDAREKETVESHTRGLALAMAHQAKTRLEIGEHLTELREVLEGKRVFRRYLKTLRFGYRTALRYMQCYRVVKDKMPDHVLKLAAARGMDLVGFQPDRPFGPYTEAVKRLPVPRVEGAVPEWLDRLEVVARRDAARRKSRQNGVDGLPPDVRLRAAYRASVGQFRRVKGAAGAAAARRWAVKLLAVLMTEFALPAQRLAPIPPPEGFRAVLGRPRLKGSPEVG